MIQRVSWFRKNWTILKSWICFFLALGLIAAVYAGCAMIIARYAPGALGYFRWGAIIAGSLGGIILIFNELLVKWIMKATRIKYRSDMPELWDAVVRTKPWWYPRPRIYLLPSHGINAIAFGWGLPFFSAVGATKGAVRTLDQNELASVMAHEMGHLVNLDMLISMVMMIAVMTMSFTGWLLWRFGPWSSSNRRSSSSSKSGGGASILVILLVGGSMYLLGRLLGIILQMFVSRQREYAADARASRTMGTSQYLINALTKIRGRAGIGGPIASTAFGALCTEDPDPSDMFSTHPDFYKRIRALQELEA